MYLQLNPLLSKVQNNLNIMDFVFYKRVFWNLAFSEQQIQLKTDISHISIIFYYLFELYIATFKAICNNFMLTKH